MVLADLLLLTVHRCYPLLLLLPPLLLLLLLLPPAPEKSAMRWC